MNKANRPTLIAHRGYSQCYPENTLASLEAALRAGAQSIEFDVQFTADSVPVVFHDSELMRVTGSEGIIQQTPFAALSQLKVKQPARFGEKFSQEPISSLQAVLSLLEEWPNATAFVEIKTATIRHFGEQQVVQVLMDLLQNYQAQCVLISFDEAVLMRAREVGMSRIGWAMREWNAQSQARALSLLPDFLFGDVEEIGGDTLWPAPDEKPWQWAVYDVVDPDEALRWFARGADFVETWDIGRMLRDARLRPSFP